MISPVPVRYRKSFILIDRSNVLIKFKKSNHKKYKKISFGSLYPPGNPTAFVPPLLVLKKLPAGVQSILASVPKGLFPRGDETPICVID